MRLTEADLRAIPCAALCRDEAGATIASTPEWSGPGPGTVVFRAGRLQLLVSSDDADPDVNALMGLLLDSLQAAVDSTAGDQQRRLTMVTAGLQLVAGRGCDAEGGTTGDVAALLRSALAAVNPRVELQLRDWLDLPVEAPAVTGLALKQLVTNAQRHDGATNVELTVRPGPVFLVRWTGIRPAEPPRASREQSRRPRWGLGYVWQSADALGGVALAPHPCPTMPSRLEASLDLNPASRRLTLPLAAVLADGRVERATASWDQETGMTPGAMVDHEVRAVVELARASASITVRVDALAARHVGRRTWVCLRPAGVRDRALDVLRGLAHEHDLLRAPDPQRTQVVALTLLLRAALGEALPRWDADAFRRQFHAVSTALGLDHVSLPGSRATPAPDPMVAAYLLATLGGEIAVSDHRWLLRPGPSAAAHPLLRLFGTDDGSIPLAGGR